MVSLKCKMCGGDLELITGENICECQYCGSRQTVPNVDDDRKAKLYERANKLRFNCDFDKAASVYENIINEFPDDAEGYWGLVLCNYGIEYVDDPATGKKVPTCHRSSFESLMDDPDFEMVMENSETAARSLYRQEAKQIEEIRKGIVEISGHEPPYDIFICYKETDEDGNRTIDSVLAQDVYDALTQKGYRVFFSRISLEDKLGTEYEPYIFAALNSAKIMLAFGTSYDNYNAVWVKNEWGRFLKLMASDKEKYLIPCFKDLDAYDIPKEFAKFQAQDLGKVGATQDLLRGIDKILSPADSKQEQQSQLSTSFSSANTAAPLLKRAFMFLEDGNFKEADDYCERVLDLDPENAQAYLGKLMAELQVRKQEDLKNCAEPFDGMGDYQKAIRFGTDILINELAEDNLFIRERNEHDRLEGIYNNALSIMKTAKEPSQFNNARAVFLTIPSYRNADELATVCDQKAKELIEQENARRIERERRAEEERIEAEQKADAVVSALDYHSHQMEYVSLKEQLQQIEQKLSDCNALNENIEDLLPKKKEINDALFLAEKKVSELQNKRQTLGLFARKEKAEIESLLENAIANRDQLEQSLQEIKKELNGFESVAQVVEEIHSLSLQAETLRGEIQKIEEQDKNIMSFNDAKRACQAANVREKVLHKNPKAEFLYAEKGKTVSLGYYHGKIVWKVLKKIDNKVLLISEYALDNIKFNDVSEKITWENCSLRKWLNSTFLNNAFSEEEQKAILSVKVSASNNPQYKTNPGNDTMDKVFVFDIEEVKSSFISNIGRLCKPTTYTKEQGIYCSKITGACWWWLRSPGFRPDCVAYVHETGTIDMDGCNVCDARVNVRPALWVDVDNPLLYRYTD